MSEIGFLYVLANSSMPGLVKVGKTTRSPVERAGELSGVTGMATPFIVVYDQLFQDCHSAESFVHAYLAARGHRVADNREFFNAPVNLVVRAIGLAPGQIEGELNAFAAPEAIDELISSNVGDELDDLELESPVQVEPWAALFEEAKAHYYGLEDYIVDYAEALRLFRQAATLGSTEAYGRIGQQYLDGEGTPKNPAKALEFFKEGARRGRPACYFFMARMFSTEGNDVNADKCFSLFKKNLPEEASSKNIFSSDEARAVDHGSLSVVMERFATGDRTRYAVINEIIVRRRQFILNAAKSMREYALKQGDTSMAESYKAAEDYITTL